MVAATTVPTSSTCEGVGALGVLVPMEQASVVISSPEIAYSISFFMFISFKKVCPQGMMKQALINLLCRKI
jgi:hypothetical protein